MGSWSPFGFSKPPGAFHSATSSPLQDLKEGIMKDVQQTSITAYNEEVKSGKIPKQRRRILEIIKRYGPLTRREIQEKTKRIGYIVDGMSVIIEDPMGSVTGRVRALIDSNLVHVSGHKKDPMTDKTVQVVSFGPKPNLNGNQYEFKI